MEQRVVITGMGAVTPIGNNISEVLESIENNYCGIDFITHFDTSEYRVKLAGEVKNLDMEQYYSKRELKFNDRFTQFARIAAKQAFIDAKLDLKTIDKSQLGVIIGSGIGGVNSIEQASHKLKEAGAKKISPYFIPMSLVNLAAGQVAIDFKANGPCLATVTACAAGTNAIGEAFHKIKAGHAKMFIAGGSEAAITPVAVAGFMAMRALHEGNNPKRASIPFDKQRSGFVMGEGSGMLILEALDHALARNAHIYGEICGYGSTCDAHHITAPLAEGTMSAKAMKLALSEAKLKPEQIEYINAHGTSTLLNDKTETRAMKLVFNDHLPKLMVSSTKSHMGHLLGASGAVEAIITLLALEKGIIPATMNYEVYDEECQLDVVANQSRKQMIHYALSNSLGFGGHNASIVLKRWEQ